MENKVKGQYNGICYRTACDNDRAIYYNHSTKEHYCPSCAQRINQVNHADAIRLFGHQLCTMVTKPPTTPSPADDIVYVPCVFDDATHFITSGTTETIQAVKPVSLSSIIEEKVKEFADYIIKNRDKRVKMSATTDKSIFDYYSIDELLQQFKHKK